MTDAAAASAESAAGLRAITAAIAPLDLMARFDATDEQPSSPGCADSAPCESPTLLAPPVLQLDVTDVTYGRIYELATTRRLPLPLRAGGPKGGAKWPAKSSNALAEMLAPSFGLPADGPEHAQYAKALADNLRKLERARDGHSHRSLKAFDQQLQPCLFVANTDWHEGTAKKFVLTAADAACGAAAQTVGLRLAASVQAQLQAVECERDALRALIDDHARAETAQLSGLQHELEENVARVRILH